MRKWLTSLLILLITIPSFYVLAQDATPTPTIEITGANASDLPEITITTNVLDTNNIPVEGLTIADFTLGGDLEGLAEIVSVENITTDDLPFASVLVIDTSTSMDGLPLRLAKEAATLFVQSVGDNDPIAIVAFDSDARLVQDYTTDKDQLLSVIDSLQVRGRTALYDAAVLGVRVASEAPVPRRAVVLLSDGAEFGGESINSREVGLQEAQQEGVSVYTIGLGFGTDRSYLENLADGTNARTYESPSPEELVAIYAELASLFRTQYVITLRSDIPADGTEYEFTLEANTPSGATNVDTGTIRAPIPVPIVILDDNLFAVPFSSPVTITPDIRADDDIQSILVSINEDTIGTEDGSFIIDPLDYPPGTYDLTVTVTDVDGDVGNDSATFETAALAPDITVDFEAGTVISEPTTITISADGQTPAIEASYSVLQDGASVGSDTTTDIDNDFPFTIDPFTLDAGDYELFINVENDGGATADATVPFSIASLPPRNVTLDGITPDSELSEPTTFTVSAETQADNGVDDVVVTILGEDAPLDTLELRPASLPPGPIELEITVVDNNGASITEVIAVEIASLPPQIILTAPPEPITTNSTVMVEVDSQTDIISVTYNFSDDIDISLPARADGSYPVIPLDVQMLGEGETTLVVEAINSGGSTATESLTFTIELPTPLPNLTATADAVATTEANAIINEQSTVSAQATNDTQATSEVQSTSDAQATSDTQSTNDAQSVADTQSTADAQATSDTQGEADAQATNDADSTASAIDDLTAEANAQLTADAQATDSAESQASTAEAIIAVATSEAATSEAVQTTADAQSTADAQATGELLTATAQGTVNAQATFDTQATLDVDATNVALTEAVPTDTATPASTILPTLTPVEIVDVTAQSAENPPAEGNMTFLICAGGAGLLGVVLLLIVFFGRNRNRNRE